MSLKFTGKLCVMTMKNDAKFKEELTFQFKIDQRNLINFDPSTLSLESTKELGLMALKIDKKFEGKLICASKNDMGNLANFHEIT